MTTVPLMMMRNPMRLIRLVTYVFVAMLGMVWQHAAFAQDFTSPYDAPAHYKSSISYIAKPCPTVIEPVLELNTVSRYSRHDKSRSTVDKKAADSYDKAIAPVRAYLQQVVDMANDYQKSGSLQYAHCTYQWLEHWAEADALATRGTMQSMAGLGQDFSALALAYLQIRPALSMQQKRADGLVAQWLARRMHETTDYFDNADSKKRWPVNNLRYWNGLAAMAVSIAAEDDALYRWALGSARMGVDHINKDGMLPYELMRKSKALDYHLFATAPLVAMAELALLQPDEKRVNLYLYSNNALHRLVRTSLDAVKSPADIAAAAKFPQQPYPGGKAPLHRLGWIALYAKRYPTAPAQDLLKSTPKLYMIGLGGDTTLWTR